MRFVYMVLLGMVIFQGVLLLISPIFPAGADYGDYAINPADLETADPATGYNSTAHKYGDVSNIGTLIISMFVSPTTILIISTFFVVGGVIGQIFGGGKNIPIAIGVGIFIGIIASLWNATIGTITLIVSSNIYVLGIFSIITVCIGIMVVFLVSEFFMGQAQGV